MTNESREAFEAWAVEQPRVAANEDCFAKSPYGAQRYEFGEVQSLWLSWQAAIQWAASQQAAPEGWRQVPVEPTDEMVNAGTSDWCRFSAPVYRAMLAAAPAQQAAEGWISVHERLPALPEDCEDDGVKVYTWDGEFVTEDVFEPQYEQPAGPAVGGWLRTGDWFCSDTASRVTHWMPRKLPAAPTAQGERDEQ